MSLHPPNLLRETWKLLDQGIIPAHLGGTGPNLTSTSPSSSTSSPKMSSPSKKQFNVAIIGYGLSAKIFHLPFLLALPDLYTLHSIVQRTPTPTNDASIDHPSITLYNDVPSMLADPAVDIVIVTSTPETHFEFCTAALNAGKHVVVEKPFVPTAAEARDLATLARDKNLHLSVYQNRRFDVDFLTLKALLREGTLGNVVELESHFDRYKPEVSRVTWKQDTDLPGNGSLYDLGTHLIDQVYSIFGPPRSVFGITQVQKWGLTTAETAPDSCTVLMRYGTEAEECLVTIKSSMVSAGETLRYWVRGTKGAFRKYYLDPQEDQLLAGLRPGDKGYAADDESRYGTLILPSSDGTFTQKPYPSVEPATYVEYYRVLAKALQGQGKVPTSADEAADVLRIIEMAQESSKTGNTIAW